MKNIKFYTLATAALCLGLTSCGDDFLTQEPASSVPVDGYYNTEAPVSYTHLTLPTSDLV